MGSKFSVLAVVLFFISSLSGCGAPEQKGEFIGVERLHATRVVVICEVGKGKFAERTIHISQAAVCGAAVIKAEDYLSGRKKFGPLPGCEKKYDAYLESKKKKE